MGQHGYRDERLRVRMLHLIRVALLAAASTPAREACAAWNSYSSFCYSIAAFQAALKPEQTSRRRRKGFSGSRVQQVSRREAREHPGLKGCPTKGPNSRAIAVSAIADNRLISGRLSAPAIHQVAGGGRPFRKLKLEDGGKKTPGHYAAALEHQFRLGPHQPGADFD